MLDSLLRPSPYATKSVKAEFKADGAKGEFTATFSVFDNVDYQGDVVRKGSFETAKATDPEPPVVYSHRWDVPPIGSTLDWDETEKGARGHGKLFVDDHEIAKQAYVGMKNGALKEFSFAYDVDDYVLREPEDDEKTPRWDGMIREISSFSRLFEWGPTIAGANPETLLESGPKTIEALVGVGPDEFRKWIGLDVDEDDLALMKRLAVELADSRRKSGARNSAKDTERLQKIHDLAVENGATCSTSDDDDESDDPQKRLDLERKRRVEEIFAATP